jgi:hypothetical protein
MRKLNVSWNPMAKEAMGKPTAIDVEQAGKTKQVHFVFNTELSSDHGEPKELLSEALVGPEKEMWLPSAVNEIMNFIKRGSWKKVPRSQARKSGKTILPSTQQTMATLFIQILTVNATPESCLSF